MIARYAEFLRRRATLVVLICLALTALSVERARHLTISTDLSALLPRGYPSVEDLHRLLKRIGGSSTLIVAVESPELKANQKFADDLVARLQTEMGGEIANIDYKIDALKRFYESHAPVYLSLEDLKKMESDLDDAIVRAKLKASPIKYDLELDDAPARSPQERLDDIEKRMDAAEKPFEKYPGGYYAGENGHLLAIFIRPRSSGSDPETARAFIAHVEQIANSLGPAKYHPQLKFSFTGSYRISLEEQAAIVHDLVSTAALCLALIAVAVFAYFRRMRSLWLLSITLVCGCAWAFALAKLTVGYLNIQTAFLGSIIAGTGINYGIILLARYLEERRRGEDEARALELAISGTGVATLTAAATTAISFGTLLIARISSFRHFAVIGGGGILFCWILSYSLLPALLVLSERFWPTTRRQQVDTRWPQILVRAAVARPRIVAGIGVIGAVIGIGAFLRFLPNILETDGRNLRNQSSVRSAAAKLDDRVSNMRGDSLTPGFVVTDSIEESKRVCDVLNERVKREGKDKAPISECRSIYSLLPDHQEEKLEVSARLLKRLQKLPRDVLKEKEQKRIADLERRLVLEPISLEKLPEELLRPFREVDGHVGRVVAVYPPEGRDLWIQQNLYRFTDSIRKIDLGDKVVTSSGDAVIFADILREISHDAPRTTALALLGVVVFVWVALRDGRTRHGLGTSSRRVRSAPLFALGRGTVHVVMALVVGVIWMVGIASLWKVKLNFFNFVAIPTTFGIAVDYAINVYARYRSGRDSRTESMRKSLRSTGGAVFLCSLTTIIGYATLLVADNLALVSFGKMAILGELCCVAASLFFLPATVLLDKNE